MVLDLMVWSVAVIHWTLNNPQRNFRFLSFVVSDRSRKGVSDVPTSARGGKVLANHSS